MDDKRRIELQGILCHVVANLEQIKSDKKNAMAAYKELITDAEGRIARLTRALQTGDETLVHEEGGFPIEDSDLN